jgi:hypothetical protein
MNVVLLHFGMDSYAVKVYGMLKDSGYYATIKFDLVYGYRIATGVIPKGFDSKEIIYSLL